MVIEDIDIQRDRTGEVLTTVDAITDWTNLKAKLFIATAYGEVPVLTLVGVIDDQTNSVTFAYDVDDTALLTVDRYVYEIVIYDYNKVFVQTVNKGIVFVVPIIKSDPTI